MLEFTVASPSGDRFFRVNTTVNFANFIEGEFNKSAKSAAMQLIHSNDSTGKSLLIYANHGLGKSHLMHAVGNEILFQDKGANVVYLHTWRFVEDLDICSQHAIAALEEFYRSADVLLVDDIQLIVSKIHHQKAFLALFDTLLARRKKVVICADRHSNNIEGLDERLKSRFCLGKIAAIEPPELDARIAILMSKASEWDVDLPHEVALFIAKRFPASIRELEGALRRVLAHAVFSGQAITMKCVKQVCLLSRPMPPYHDT